MRGAGPRTPIAYNSSVSSAAPPRLQFAFDRLVLSDRRLFGWGWAAHGTRRVSTVALLVGGNGATHRICAGYGLSRPDVEEAYPALPEGGTSGFVVTGFVECGELDELALEIGYEDGGVDALDVKRTAQRLRPAQTRRNNGRWLLGAIWRRLKLGDVSGLVRRARLQLHGARKLDEAEVLDRLIPALRECGELCLMFDHDMGGGANQYRAGAIRERLGAGESVLLCTYNLPLLAYRLRLIRAGGEEQAFTCASFQVLESVIGEVGFAEIFVNSPVSFDEPLVLAEWLARMRQAHPRTRLTVTMHDYFAICPSFVLLDADGRYCGIPDISQCNGCMKRHRASFVSLTPPTEMGPWRALWGRCLEAADEVRCFSEATRELTRRAYPGIRPERITVLPHQVDFAPARRPRIRMDAPLVIGVMGEISYQKGAKVVKEMVELIDRDHPEARVVVLGTLDIAIKSPRLTVTGRYRREELVDLVERHAVNMFVFPSIWPETFSYVVAELAMLDVPIVAFDFGAPAERLRDYPRGRLCAEPTGAAALAAAIDFHEELVAPRSAAA